jgi:hypothetical protein
MPVMTPSLVGGKSMKLRNDVDTGLVCERHLLSVTLSLRAVRAVPVSLSSD